jgi:hypothetical protein
MLVLILSCYIYVFCVWHLMSVQEYYEFLESDAKNIFTKLGTFAWLAMAIAVVETLICIKFSKGWEGNEVAGPLRACLSRCPAVISALCCRSAVWRLCTGASLHERSCDGSKQHERSCLSNCWLICFALHRYTCRLFPQPWPTHVLWAWGIASVVFTVTFGTWCWRFYVLGKRPAGGRSVSARQKTQ